MPKIGVVATHSILVLEENFQVQ